METTVTYLPIILKCPTIEVRLIKGVAVDDLESLD